ncbi:hypothetical protein [Nonomuraea sp. NPDC048826]|uniref:hypothetical protein n=1 Tax=Nonomuraea sp. NPDC048826 TaxID=3364347 RepID=UPI0037209089
MTSIPVPPLAIDPEQAVRAITGAHAQAQEMVDRHWQPSIEDLDDQGAAHRVELKTLLRVIDAAGFNIEPLITAWRENWEAYQRNGGTVAFTSIGNPDWRTR